MKRLMFALMLIVGITTTASAQKLYEYTYKESNHFSNSGPMNYHKQAKLVGEKCYFIYDRSTNTFSHADKNGKILTGTVLLSWDEEHGHYTNFGGLYIDAFNMESISPNGKIHLWRTADDKDYDICHVYTLSSVRDI